MNRIQALAPEVINQIAAGEIIERPASVLKELVENALDAGGTDLTVSVQDGGLRSLRLVDNGMGMSAEDARLAVRRHTTSKLRGIDDLQALRSFGFRGEALASIASVSKLTLCTKRPDDEVGTRLRMVGDDIVAEEQVGLAGGTDLLVEDLFHNVPARRKFLKTPGAEYAKLHETLVRLALPAAETSFRLIKDGKQVLHLPATSSFVARICKAFPQLLPEHLLEVSEQREEASLYGFLSGPDYSRSMARQVMFYVNGRLISDRRLGYAVQEAYRTLLLVGRHPFCVLFLNLPPDRVDVNVHPQKSEVRFLHPEQVFSLVLHTVRAALSGLGKPATASIELPSSAGLPPLPRFEPTSPRRGAGTWLPATPREPLLVQASLFDVPSPPSLPMQPELGEESGDYAETGRYYRDLVYLGQFRRTYLVCERNEELVLVDQHAAYERLNFEWLAAAYRNGRGASQDLLFPERVELGRELGADYDRLATALGRLGFVLEPFSSTSVVVRSVPEILARGDVAGLVEDAFAELTSLGDELSLGRALDNLLATMACHQSVRADQPVAEEDVRRLFRDLDTISNAHHCPHGRPIHQSLPLPELERLFKRR